MGHSVGKRLCALLAAGLAAALLFSACGGGRRGYPEQQDRFAGPTRMALAQNFLDPYGHYLFITNNQGGTISVVNAQHYTVLSSHTNDIDDIDVIRVGRAPFDLALNPAGDRLFVTDAWLDNVRVVSGWAGRRPDVFNVHVDLDEANRKILEYDIEVTELDLAVRAGELAIQSLPAADREFLPLFVTDPDNMRVVVVNAETGEETDEIILPEEPARIAITPSGDLLFLTTTEGNLLFADAGGADLLPDWTLELGGVPGAIAVNADQNELYVLNADPPELHLVRLTVPPRLLDTDISIPASPNGLAATKNGEHVYVAADDGYVYVFDTETQRFCNSWGGRVFFTDEWPPSNPGLERIEVEDCLVWTEQWEIIYHMDIDEWTVRGTRSGLQAGRAKSNQYYVTDHGELGFFIRENEFHASDQDTFYFETDVGISPLRVGLVPDSLVVSRYYLNPEFDVLFTSNTGSHSLSILFSEDQQRLGIIN